MSAESAARDVFAELANCAGPDDPLFKAATLLADAWAPALDRSYWLGYENGYAAGYREADREMQEAWRGSVRDLKAFWKASDEAAKYRSESGVA